MLSDEERELIEEIQKGNKIGIYELIRTFKREGIENFITVRRKYIDIILNLIEKQSKEIEELKNEVMEKELIIDGMKEDRRIAVEEIQEQYFVSKEESEQKERKAYIKGTNDAHELCNKKWKDKIKAKIEEYDDKGMTVNLANRSVGKTFQQAVHYEVKKVLQELLEKE